MSVEPYRTDGQVTLHLGDCAEVLAGMDAASVDAVVTDPPYGLEFMGREWDSFKPSQARIRSRVDARTNPAEGKSVTVTPESYTAGQPFQAWCQQWAAGCLRVLKPGGHLLAFGGTRTWHRLACGIEDAGFEIRDSTGDLTGFDGPGLAWAYGQGMPKNQDAGRAVDMHVCDLPGRHCMRKLPPQPRPDDHVCPESQEGDAWRGWGTAWKPSWEPIVCARKPLAGTLGANLLEHGVGAINIAGCRLPPTGESRERDGEASQDRRYANQGGTNFAVLPGTRGGDPAGRWPPNLLLGPAAAAAIDGQSGTRKAGASVAGTEPSSVTNGIYGEFTGRVPFRSYGDSGGASRFFPVFYAAKATTGQRPQLEDGTSWPTVKPLDLMRHLCRSVTPPGGLVLDLFAGTGPTAEACIVDGFRCVLVDKDPTAIALIETRLRKDIQPDMFGGAA